MHVQHASLRTARTKPLTFGINVQTIDGKDPSGLTAMEFQEWFRLRALPAMQACADSCFFMKGGDHWFTEQLEQSYQRLVKATQYGSAYHRKFLIAHDQDRRHSMLHYPRTVSGKRGKAFDRRSVPPGQRFHIPADSKRDYIPTAPKVPDCIQSPIEMFFAPVKIRFKQLLAEHRMQGKDSSFRLVANLALQAFRDKGEAERAGKCWQHAVRKALPIFSKPYKQWFTIDGERVNHCLYGFEKIGCPSSTGAS